MPFNPQPLRYLIATAVFLLIGYSHSSAQVVCETGYYADYITGGHLLPAAITSLHNGQQVITGKASVTAADRMKGMVVRISETGSVLWSIAMDSGEGAALEGMLEKANGQYIVYGNLYSAADPDGKIWLVCLDQAGNLQWSRVIESGHPGPERLYSLIELPDGDLAGTFNIADSTNSSRPVVFRMRDDGTLRWTREYAQNQAVAFNSLSFANGKIYAAGFQRVVKKKALIMLLDEGTGDIVERRYPAYYNQNYEQEAAFIQVFNNRISYIIRFRDPAMPNPLFSTVFVQSSLDNTTSFGTQKSGVETNGEQVHIKRTRYNDWMIMRSYNYQSQLINHSHPVTPVESNGLIIQLASAPQATYTKVAFACTVSRHPFSLTLMSCKVFCPLLVYEILVTFAPVANIEVFTTPQGAASMPGFTFLGNPKVDLPATISDSILCKAEPVTVTIQNTIAIKDNHIVVIGGFYNELSYVRNGVIQDL